MAIAKAGDVVLVSTKILLLGGSVKAIDLANSNICLLGLEGSLEFEGAELLIDDLPHDLV